MGGLRHPQRVTDPGIEIWTSTMEYKTYDAATWTIARDEGGVVLTRLDGDVPVTIVFPWHNIVRIREHGLKPPPF